jgi:hypothetical protein
MKKYNIEGQIDFFNELYKSLDIEENKFKTDDDNNLCLISNQPLVDKHIIMNCGHKFNYLPLFLDIKNHKQKFNNMEGGTSHLSNDEIRCPYCRKKQKGLLPFYEELGLSKINGVNYVDLNSINNHKLSLSGHYPTCEYLTPNIMFDPSGNNPEDTNSSNTGNCKFFKCFHIGSKIKYSNKKGLIDYNFGDDKNYCNIHKKPLLQIYKKAKQDKEKEEAKKAKEEAKKNEKEKNEKLKQICNQIKNLEKNDFQTENKIIGIINLQENETNNLCNIILKTGPNKGKQCGGKISENNLCSRHNKLNNKKNKDEI